MVPVSSDRPVRNFESTVAIVRDDGSVAFRYASIGELVRIGEFLGDVVERLRGLDGRFVVWGAKPNTPGISVKCRDAVVGGRALALFYYGPRGLVFVGRIVAATVSEKLAEKLWGRDDDNST